jgi:hypothetical protein
LEPLPVLRISVPAANVAELEAALRHVPLEIVRSAVA